MMRNLFQSHSVSEELRDSVGRNVFKLPRDVGLCTGENSKL